MKDEPMPLLLQNWWTTTLFADAVPPVTPLESAVKCDVLVVGGGMVGISAAAAAARAGKSVALVERNILGGDDGAGGYAPLAIVTGTTLNWVHSDHLGVPVAYTNTAGTAVTPAAFTVSGFPGQLRTFADLYYNRYRDYDTSTGRYIQADPIGLEGGGNDYLYAGANPVTGVDPWGLEKVILYNLKADKAEQPFYDAAAAEPNRSGICAVYGHMSIQGILATVDGIEQLVKDVGEMKRIFIKGGCKENQPVYFLGCNAANGKFPIAYLYAKLNHVMTVAADSYTFWDRRKFIGIYDRKSYNKADPNFGLPNKRARGQFRVFKP
jgi:RHS repeat-associated protein